MRSGLLLGLSSTIVLLFVSWVSPALAHRSGCHTLHSCLSDSGSYICGDLGYPCNGVASINDIALEDIVVPLLVEATFEQIFERAPSEAESDYWKRRFRSDKGSLTKIRRAMRWHKTVGSYGPSVARVEMSKSAVLVARINALFRAANGGRNPTGSENRYWISRIGDKLTEDVMQGAMVWHKQNNIGH